MVWLLFWSSSIVLLLTLFFYSLNQCLVQVILCCILIHNLMCLYFHHQGFRQSTLLKLCSFLLALPFLFLWCSSFLILFSFSLHFVLLVSKYLHIVIYQLSVRWLEIFVIRQHKTIIIIVLKVLNWQAITTDNNQEKCRGAVFEYIYHPPWTLPEMHVFTSSSSNLSTVSWLPKFDKEWALYGWHIH